MITERQQTILETIIEEYIKEASPVGSKHLDAAFDFGIGPAMIRQEMAALEEEGYLASPHTSAGRVPTDKAYRFYISQKLSGKVKPLANREQEKVKNAIGEAGDLNELARDIARLAAELSQELSVAGFIDRGTVFTSGLSRLIAEPELRDFESARRLMRFVDELDGQFLDLWNKPFDRDLAVFIGEENPIREMRNFTFITGHYNLPQGERGFLSLVGPRRMDYRRNIDLVRYISREIERIW